MPKPTDPPTIASAKAIMAQRRARYFQKAAERDPLLIPRGKNMPAKIAASLAKGKPFRQVI